jgi:Flp pilus assembly protein TadD
MIRIRTLRASGIALALALLATTAIPATAQTSGGPNPSADRLSEQVRILAADPRNLEALISAGQLSAKLGDTSAALAFLARAEAVDPNDARIFAARGSTMVQMEKPGEALRMFNEAERRGLAPDQYAADRGFAYDLLGAPELAQRDYRVALQHGNDDETVRRLALSLGISGRGDEAMTLLDPLLRRSDRPAWRARAFIMAMGGDVTGAEKIAASMMPGNMGAALTPFFRKLPSLGAADRAFAVHFGELTPTAARVADARTAPPLPAFTPYRPPVVAAATPTPAPAAAAAAVQPAGKDRRSRRQREEDERLALAAARVQPVPAAVPTPTSAAAPLEPPHYQAPTVQPLPGATTGYSNQVATLPAETDVRVHGQVGTTVPAANVPSQSRPVETRPAPVYVAPPRPVVTEPAASPVEHAAAAPPRPAATPRTQERSLAQIMAGVDANEADKPAASSKSAKPTKAELAKAAKEDAEDAKPGKKGKKGKDPAKAEPARIWVQVAGGANQKALPGAWQKLVKQSPATFKGHSAYTTPLHATNRLLTGPFESDDEAQEFVNKLRKEGISSFQFNSDAGQKVAKLGGKTAAAESDEDAPDTAKKGSAKKGSKKGKSDSAAKGSAKKGGSKKSSSKKESAKKGGSKHEASDSKSAHKGSKKKHND